MTQLPDGAFPALHAASKIVGKALYRPFYRIRIHGLARVPRTGPLVLIANHSSLIEPQLLYGVLPRCVVFLVKQELFTGVLGWYLQRIGQIPVRRGHPDPAPLRTATSVLSGDGMIGVFPEGTRGDGQVRSAEQGAAWLVRATGATVLPVAIRGTLRPGPRRRFRPPIDVLVGEPFTMEVGRGKTGLIDGTERVRGELARLVSALDQWRGTRAQQTGKEQE